MNDNTLKHHFSGSNENIVEYKCKLKFIYMLFHVCSFKSVVNCCNQEILVAV